MANLVKYVLVIRASSRVGRSLAIAPTAYGIRAVRSVARSRRAHTKNSNTYNLRVASSGSIDVKLASVW